MTIPRDNLLNQLISAKHTDFVKIDLYPGSR